MERVSGARVPTVQGDDAEVTQGSRQGEALWFALLPNDQGPLQQVLSESEITTLARHPAEVLQARRHLDTVGRELSWINRERR